MAYGYEYEYGNELFVSKRVKKKKLKPKQWGPGAPVIRIVEPCFDAKGKKFWSDELLFVVFLRVA